MENLNEDVIALLLWEENEDENGEDHDANNVHPEVMEEEREEEDMQPADAVVANRNDDDVELGPFVLGKDMTTTWSVIPPTKRGRPLARNILIIKPGPKNGAEQVKSPLEAWNLLFTQEMIESIVLHTNQEIDRKSAHYSLDNYSVNPTNCPEVKALIGLYYLAGVLRGSGLNVEDLWSPIYGNHLFRATMSMKRFLFLTDCLRFDDKRTRLQRSINDKFTPIRSLWNSFIENCINYYSPSAHVTIDEQLVSCKVRCPFLMYMPNKPGKYGIKFVMMNDSKTYYMCDAIPYVGKVTDKRPNELVPEYYVRKLSESIAGSKRNITCDNWFTTVPLVDSMLQRELTMIGTLRKNKPQIPPCLFQERAVNSSVFVFDANKTLVSFSPKRKKNVVLVSSMHHDDTIDTETEKPEIIIVYNKSKGGTDSFDKLCATFSTSRKNQRWPMQVFYGMLDQGGVNAYVLFVLANPRWKEKKQHNRRFFLKDLSTALTREHMIVRSQQRNIPRNLKLQMKAILSHSGEREDEDQESEDEQEGQPDNKQKRCYMCDRKKDRKSKARCSACRKPVCKEHSVDTCKNCGD